MANEPSLVLKGIRRIDLMELREELPEGSVELVPAGDMGESGVHGQPVSDLAVIVALSLPTIQALAVWLAKRRVRTTKEHELTFKSDSEGNITLTMRGTCESWGSEPPDHSVVEALRAQLSALLPDDRTEQ